MEERLQKIIASYGITSRRKAEEFIEEGRVTVNGKVAVLGAKADPDKDHIKVDGKLITGKAPLVYLIFYKPKGILTSLSDAQGRPTVGDYIKKIRERVYPVGRLDFHSEGLILLTNNGAMTHALLHPSKKIPKKYHVKVKGVPKEEQIKKIGSGIRLDDGPTMPAEIKPLGTTQTGNNSWFEVIIYEGKKRQIRRMFDKIKHPVMKLKRIAVDGVSLGKLKPGEFRYLTEHEVQRLEKACRLRA